MPAKHSHLQDPIYGTSCRRPTTGSYHPSEGEECWGGNWSMRVSLKELLDACVFLFPPCSLPGLPFPLIQVVDTM